MPHGLTSSENMCSFKAGGEALLLVVCDIVSSLCTGEVFILDSSWAASEVGKKIAGPGRNYFSFFEHSCVFSLTWRRLFIARFLFLFSSFNGSHILKQYKDYMYNC